MKAFLFFLRVLIYRPLDNLDQPECSRRAPLLEKKERIIFNDSIQFVNVMRQKVPLLCTDEKYYCLTRGPLFLLSCGRFRLANFFPRYVFIMHE